MPEPNLYFGDVKVLLPENLFYYTKTGKKKQAPPITKTKALSSRNKIKSVDVSVRPDIVKPLVKFPKGRFPKPNANMSVDVLEAIIDADPPQQVVEQVRDIIEDKIDELEELKGDIDVELPDRDPESSDVDVSDVEGEEVEEDEGYYTKSSYDDADEYDKKQQTGYDSDIDLEELLEKDEEEEDSLPEIYDLETPMSFEFDVSYRITNDRTKWLNKSSIKLSNVLIDNKPQPLEKDKGIPFLTKEKYAEQFALYLFTGRNINDFGFYGVKIFYERRKGKTRKTYHVYEVSTGKDTVVKKPTQFEMGTIHYKLVCDGTEQTESEVRELLESLGYDLP